MNHKKLTTNQVKRFPSLLGILLLVAACNNATECKQDGSLQTAFNKLVCLLVGIGAFVTGEAVRFRPMTVGGLLGAAIGVGSFLLQGKLWPWQMLCVVAVAVVALIIPGYMFERYVRHGV